MKGQLCEFGVKDAFSSGLLGLSNIHLPFSQLDTHTVRLPPQPCPISFKLSQPLTDKGLQMRWVQAGRMLNSQLPAPAL